MTLTINGSAHTFGAPLSLSEIMRELGIEAKVQACAVNMQIIKKDLWSSFYPKNGDVLELLSFVGGG